MIDLQKLSDLINNRGIMSKSFQSMTRDDIIYICKSVIMCQEPGYVPTNKELASCYKHNFWVVYRDKACAECNDKEVCPQWTTKKK